MKGVKMTNKKYLEEVKKEDRAVKACEYNIEYRRTKALEIIAEELIELNKSIAEITKVDMLIKYGQEETRPENGDWEVRVMKDEKE
jgi:hypothetical protein